MVDLRAAVAGFLTILRDETDQDEIVGLASYNQAAQLEHALTDDYDAIQQSVDALVPDGQTNIGGGIDKGIEVLQGGRPFVRVEKTLIVMTDGYHNTGTDPLEAAERAAAQNIKIHAITFGRRSDKVRMQAVAAIGKGNYYHAPDGTALREIYEEIAFTMRTVLAE
jgi:Mg-chelatase subunit ChlD